MMGRHDHCMVWKSKGDYTEIVCAHCGHVFHHFFAVEGDEQRAEASRHAHAQKCPGTPKCVRRR